MLKTIRFRMASDQSNNISETQSKSISDTPSNSISDSFTTISGRQSRRAEEYFTSDRFISQLKEKIERDLIRGKDNYAELQYPDVDATRNDMPLLQLAFDKLKAEYAELDHIRITKEGSIILDTKPNTWIRRNLLARGQRGAELAY